MRRIAAFSLVAVLALGACGNDDTSSIDATGEDTTNIDNNGGGTSSGSLCTDIESFMNAADSLPAEDPQDNDALVNDIDASLDAMRASSPDDLNVNYDEIEQVMDDLISILQEFDYDLEAIDADPDASTRLQDLSQSSAVVTNFTELTMYYETNCRMPDIGS